MHAVVTGGIYGYLKLLAVNRTREGYFPDAFGMQIAGGSIVALLCMTFLTFVLLYMAIGWTVIRLR
ncbi:hypothetical protein ACLBWT_07345 [Paenibacillus sp. D51F]